MTDHDTNHPLARNAREIAGFAYYQEKVTDVLNVELGHGDGYWHHHFAVGDFDRGVLKLTGPEREAAIRQEIHRMETRQVDTLIDLLAPLGPTARVLDAGSGRGGSAFLIHRALGCRIDAVNFVAHQNQFARAQAERRGCAAQVVFHDRSMTATGLPSASFDAVYTNETTMFVYLEEAFAEFARLLKPGARYVLTTWCVNDAADGDADAAVIDGHYACHTHRRSAYLRALLDAGLVPYQVDDLTGPAIPYWELRRESELATGIETTYLSAYRGDRINYMRIGARKAHPDAT
ncbi:SAM-dependent methyltransferase [Streptomyces sp. NPDC090023]|uniref:SAM-dependent methyltransferase n=1 Tax=unclassified Streptomyces TaxID=2593676 RepID=UPI003813A3BB